MKSMRAWLALSMLVLGLSAQAAPTTVFSQGPANLGTGERSDTSILPVDAASIQFTVSVSAPVLQVQWWGFDVDGYADPSVVDDFTVVLGGSSFTTGGSRLLVGSTGNYGLYLYTLDVGSAYDLVSSAPTTLSIQNNSFDVGWFWGASTNGSLAARVIADVTTSTVPEPAGLAFLAAALALAAARRRA